jgi:ABC-type transport system involved in cytochrome bd biosynthesis fused ATPase/permease subunit
MPVAFGVVILVFGLLNLIFLDYDIAGSVVVTLLVVILIIPPLTLSENGFEKYRKFIAWLGSWG